MNAYIGWDVGGAHLKAIVLDKHGVVVRVIQQPCPLWKGLEQLKLAVNAIKLILPDFCYRHGVTMTGELADCFLTREEGVKQIIATLHELIGANELFIYAGLKGLLPLAEITEAHYSLTASANWLASAQFVASKIDNAVFVDIGSTTTDILLIKDGQVVVTGYTDYQRLVSKELVYTGIVRTPVMAIAREVVDQGRIVGLMAEFFATMADVYRLTGELDEACDQYYTADGANKTLSASATRLSRMIGCDFYEEELARWLELASKLRAEQIDLIFSAIKQVAENSGVKDFPVLVGAGVGRFLLKPIAERLNSSLLDFSAYCAVQIDQTDLLPADCAPAAAVAQLLRDMR